MELQERAVSRFESSVRLPLLRARIVVRERFAEVQPLLSPFTGAWLLYIGIAALVHSEALRIYDAGGLPALEVLRNTAHALAPDALLGASRQTTAGTMALLCYALVACLAVAVWCWAIRVCRSIALTSIAPVLLLTVLLAVPLVGLTGLFSDDVYLYDFYGRMMVVYGANPILHAPDAFAQDPHFPWVHWPHLPSAYGPVWLLLSAPLSAMAGDSLSGVVIVYRLAALALHLGVACALWIVLRRQRPEHALAGTLFYAWNPLVLVEVVGNAHNDVLVALFAVLLIAAAAERAWARAAVFGACAVMVKPFSALLLPPLALRMLGVTRGYARLAAFGGALAVGLLSLVVLNLPLWAGAQLLTNIASNPASHAYTNSVWELMYEAGAAWPRTMPEALRDRYIDWLRMVLFVAGGLWVLTRRWAPWRPAQTAFGLWVVFSLTTAWLWPWYFVPAIALAALSGRAPVAVGTAMTLGGLLFWAIWTPPPFSLLYPVRSLVLLGPVLATLAWSPARTLAFAALGSRLTRDVRADEPVDVRLQTAAG